MAVHTCISRKSFEGEPGSFAAEHAARFGPYEVVGDCPDHAGSIHVKRYEGAVLGTWEHNGSEDSDFYALVWDGEGLRSIEYATTRGWTYHNGAVADATAEVREAARAALIERDIKAWAEATAIDAATVTKGKTVRVTKGRKVPIGTEGEVFWLGENRYGWRVGIKDADGTVHWTAEANVEVVDAEQYLTPLAEIVKTATARVNAIGKGYISGTLQEYKNEDDPGYAKQASWAWVSAYRSYGGALGSTRAYHRLDQGRALVDEQAVEAALERAAEARLMGAEA